MQALLLEKVISGFREKHGREPTDEELENLIDVMNEQAEAEEDTEQDEQVMEALEGHVRTTFESSQGRAPTDEEIEAIMAALTGQVTLPEEQEVRLPCLCLSPASDVLTGWSSCRRSHPSLLLRRLTTLRRRSNDCLVAGFRCPAVVSTRCTGALNIDN